MNDLLVFFGHFFETYDEVKNYLVMSTSWPYI